MARGLIAAWCFVLALPAATAWAADVAIQVAPQAVNLDSKGEWLTIHVDIPYGLVDLGSLQVTVGGAGVSVAWTKADDCGDLVIKLDLAAVKATLKGVEPGPVTVTVSGATNNGETFGGVSTIRVVKNPKR